MPKQLERTIAFLASFGFACILFLFLALLTFFGTLEQVQFGLFDTQKKYFESLFVIHKLAGRIPIPLPGVYLLLILLSVNLILGGIIRLRRSWNTAGILVAHLGIVLMLFAGYVKLHYSIDGFVQIWPNRPVSEFQSHFHWELSVFEIAPREGKLKEYTLPDADFMHEGRGASVTVKCNELPFDLRLRRIERNAAPLRESERNQPPHPSEASRRLPSPTSSYPAIDGFYLQPYLPDKSGEFNVAGCYVTVIDKNTGRQHESLLTGFPGYPFAVEVDGRQWAIGLQKERYPLAFSIGLKQFMRKLHPRTMEASEYQSEVVKIEHGIAEEHLISMNEPLRHKGFTFFQADFGPKTERDESKMYSVLAVARNPSDQWPLYSCIVIAAGLLFHFSQKLYRHIKAEARKPSWVAGTASSSRAQS